MDFIDDTTTTVIDHDDTDADQMLILDGKERLRYFLNLQSTGKAVQSPLRRPKSGLLARLRRIFS